MVVVWAMALGLAVVAGPPAPVDERALAAEESSSRASHRDTARRDSEKMSAHPAWWEEDRNAAGGKDPAHLPLEKKHQATLKRLQHVEAAHRKLEVRHAALEKKHRRSARTAVADHRKMTEDHERMVADHDRIRRDLEEIVTAHESMLKEHGKAQLP